MCIFDAYLIQDRADLIESWMPEILDELIHKLVF